MDDQSAVIAQSPGDDPVIYQRFRDFMEGLIEEHKPNLDDMIETLDHVWARTEQSQIALVAGHIRPDFHRGEMRHALNMRKLLDFLHLVKEHEGVVGTALREGAKRAKGGGHGRRGV